jgi:hypothetical protein
MIRRALERAIYLRVTTTATKLKRPEKTKPSYPEIPNKCVICVPACGVSVSELVAGVGLATDRRHVGAGWSAADRLRSDEAIKRALPPARSHVIQMQHFEETSRTVAPWKEEYAALE